ncbi:hypothetical protein TNCV_3658921 [Trichonephila clavipes]|nr:hypothetical protein TNCV_3658921 [Trichonephila clavipes]
MPIPLGYRGHMLTVTSPFNAPASAESSGPGVIGQYHILMFSNESKFQSWCRLPSDSWVWQSKLAVSIKISQALVLPKNDETQPSPSPTSLAESILVPAHQSSISTPGAKMEQQYAKVN